MSLQIGTVYFFLFNPFSFVIALASTSSSMLNKNNDSGLPCLFPSLSEKAFSISVCQWTVVY